MQQDGPVIALVEATPITPAFDTVQDKFGATFTIEMEIRQKVKMEW